MKTKEEYQQPKAQRCADDLGRLPGELFISGSMGWQLKPSPHASTIKANQSIQRNAADSLLA